MKNWEPKDLYVKFPQWQEPRRVRQLNVTPAFESSNPNFPWPCDPSEELRIDIGTNYDVTFPDGGSASYELPLDGTVETVEEKDRRVVILRLKAAGSS